MKRNLLSMLVLGLFQPLFAVESGGGSNKSVSQVRTKLNKDDKSPKISAVTLDWEGCTMEMLKPVATDGLIINLQGKWRRAGTIPAQVEVKVKDLVAGMGSRSVPATVDGLAAVAGSMKPEEVEALIAKLREESKAREKASAPAKSGKGGQKAAAKGDGGTSPTA